MARFIAVLIAGLVSASAYAAQSNRVRLAGEFIDINGETSEISFRSYKDSQDAMFVTAEDTICFSGMILIGNICIKKEIATKGNRIDASLRVTNAPKGIEARMNCGNNSHISLMTNIDYRDLGGCKLTFQMPATVYTFWGPFMINGNVSASFGGDSLAVRFFGDFGTCKMNDVKKCQEAWLFQTQSDLAKVISNQEIVGIFKIVQEREQ
jgi:hypothetical protein